MSTISPDELIKELSGIVGESFVSNRPSDQRVYARDMWPRLLLNHRDGKPPKHLPNAIVWPQNAREIAAIVRFARQSKLAVIPYGGGSGVCGGVVPLRGGVTIDLKRMNAIKSVSPTDMSVDVEAGANGERFERSLGTRGFTLGHFPSSIYCSTVGGWLACRAAGQLSTKYGKIEDRVLGLSVVTGKGEVIHTDGITRARRGPNWDQLLVGSEGCFGIITSARLRLNPSPEIFVLRGFEFPDVATGARAIRKIMQAGLRPAVIRLYDDVDTFINHVSVFSSDQEKAVDRNQFAPMPGVDQGALAKLPNTSSNETSGLGGQLLSALSPKKDKGFLSKLRKSVVATALSHPSLINSTVGALAEKGLRKGCRLIVGLEGPRIRTEVEARLTFSKLELAGGTDQGEEPGREWLEHRYAVSYKMSSIFQDGSFVDTMEVAATWDRLLHLYQEVKQAISRHAVVMAHFSHAYHDGCSIYFSFAARGDTKEESESIYDAIWRDGLSAASRAGGTISHHHGIGMLKSDFMQSEHRNAMTILNALKDTFDPDNIMNPGKLGFTLHRSAPKP